MPLQLKFKIDAFPFIAWSFMCPQCNAHVPIEVNQKGMIPCPQCGYRFYRRSFDKKYENVVNAIRTATGAKVIDF